MPKKKIVPSLGERKGLPTTDDEIISEAIKCRKFFPYFVNKYCQLLTNEKESAEQGAVQKWARFRLWPQQETVAEIFADKTERKIISLKARQLGFTWIAAGLAVHNSIFHSIATVLLFSKTDEESKGLLNRVKGIYAHLPDFLKTAKVVINSAHKWELDNGSSCQAFPTTGGQSYTGTLAIIDEADYPDIDLQRLLNAVMPTVEDSGKLILISTSDKGEPESVFKKMYRAAPTNGFRTIFLPWHARPERNQEWYDQQVANEMAESGCLDNLYEKYPATPEEALAPRSQDKRLPFDWLTKCYQKSDGIPHDGPTLNGLVVYRKPKKGETFCLGADTSEGNPTSDESCCVVMDADSGEEVANLAGRFEPATFAYNLDQLGAYYNGADIMVERNNHGHAVLLWLKDNSTLNVLKGHDSAKGWMTLTKGKAMIYANAGENLRDGDCIIHNPETYHQLISIEGSTLKAPEGQHDDRAMGYVLALIGRVAIVKRMLPSEFLKKWAEAGDELKKRDNALLEPPPIVLPETEKGGVQYVRVYGEWHVYLNVGGRKQYIFSSMKEAQSVLAAKMAGIAVDADYDFSEVPLDRRAEIELKIEDELAKLNTGGGG